MAETTDRPPAAGRSSAAPPARRLRPGSGPDRVSVILFSLAATLVVLALLAGQLAAGTSPAAGRHQVLIRRIYRTTVVDTGAGAGGTSVSQSVSSSGSGPTPSTAPVTSSSHS